MESHENALTARSDQNSMVEFVRRDAEGLEAEVRRFLADIFFLGDDPASLPASKSLIESGVIDSTGILELVGFLEEAYGIRIEDDELLPENLDSIDYIVKFVTRKQASG